MPDEKDDPGQTSGGKDKDRSALKAGIRAAGESLSRSSQDMMTSARDEAASRIGPVQYRHGGKPKMQRGKVHNTAVVRIHRNERVIPANKRKRVEGMMKREGMRLTNKRRS